MHRNRYLLRLTLLTVALLPVMVHAQTQRFPITRAAVVEVLAQEGIAVQEAGIHLPGPVLAAVPSPALRLAELHALAPERLRVRVLCQDAHMCLPFYITADVPHAESLAAIFSPPASGSMALSAKPGAVGRSMHVGEHTTLLLEDRFMRISLPVVSIDAGKVGDDIRVSSLDRKQTFHATLAEDGSLHGMLP